MIRVEGDARAGGANTVIARAATDSLLCQLGLVMCSASQRSAAAAAVDPAGGCAVPKPEGTPRGMCCATAVPPGAALAIAQRLLHFA